MNIVEAFKRAECNYLITNCFLENENCFLKYISEGCFYQYKIFGKKASLMREVRKFDFCDIISNSWKVIPNHYFINNTFIDLK